MEKNAIKILVMLLLFALVFSTSVFATASKIQTVELETAAGSTENVKNTVMGVNYRTHIQNDGWETGWTADGKMSGTEGRSLRLEGIQIELSGAVPDGAMIDYRAHVQNDGWETAWTANGETAGTEGRCLRMEGIQIQLVNMPNYSVQYRTHVQNDGWETEWSADGETAGTEGRSLRLEGIEIRIVNLTRYNEILAAIELLNETDYTVQSWENLQTVMNEDAVDGHNSQTAIDVATTAIQTASEALVLNKTTQYFMKAGFYGPESGTETIHGDVIIQGGGVTLRNFNIDGNIIIEDEVGSGEVILTNLRVNGETIISGGGNVVLEGCFESILINQPDSQLELRGATIIENIIVAPEGCGSGISLNTKATVNRIIFNGASHIRGAGTIKNAEVNADEVTYEKVPEYQIVSPGVIIQPQVIPGPLAPTPGGEGSYTVSVTGITVDKESLTLTGVNTTSTITAGIQPTNATNQNILWSSSDETVVTVSNGLVTAVALGTANITAASADNGAITAVTAVMVESPAAPPAPLYTIDCSNETTAEIVPDSVEYADNSEMISSQTGTGEKVPLNPGDSAKTLYFRVKAAGNTPAGNVQWLDIPARPPAPATPTGAFLDGINQIVGAAANTAYCLNVIGTEIFTNMTADGNGIISFPDEESQLSSKTTVFRLRYPAGSDCFASAWTSSITVTYLNSIAVTAPPTKTTYKIGDSSLDLTGLVVTGTYRDGMKEDLTIVDNNVSGFDSTNLAAVQTLTVTFGGRTASFNISVTKADGPELWYVSRNDSKNTMSGLTAAMEFSEDGTHWTTYNETLPNLPDLTGKITLQVRMAETETQTAGPAENFKFTKSVNYTVTANANAGSVATAMTTELTLTFDSEPVGLSIDNIKLDGAQKGTLTGTGLMRTLTISDVTGLPTGDPIKFFVYVNIYSTSEDYTIVNTGKSVANITLLPRLSGEGLIAYYCSQPTSFQLRFQFNEAVTYYYVLQSYTGDQPAAMTPAEIKIAPTKTGTLNKETLFYEGIAGLTPLTKYVVYLYAEDSAGNPALFYTGTTRTDLAMLHTTTTDYTDGDKAFLDAKSIESGTYEIPIANQMDQETKTAWVQAAVNVFIKYGSTATVTWNDTTSKYDVSVFYGTSPIKKPVITVTNKI
ncbi:bacterial Ig-like domain-containing protein [Acetobacterium bakii]|uniref:bacterial Ig-like domain-containing protein n=1 Tax=Acetobacterium bakii TaxID=52689 RepID=UPI0006813E4D|nr:bacterial Ig-like domain-containing protein [Acetobacterium bakii]